MLSLADDDYEDERDELSRARKNVDHDDEIGPPSGAPPAAELAEKSISRLQQLFTWPLLSFADR